MSMGAAIFNARHWSQMFFFCTFTFYLLFLYRKVQNNAPSTDGSSLSTVGNCLLRWYSSVAYRTNIRRGGP